MNLLKNVCLLCLLCGVKDIFSVSFVYNLRISEITRRQAYIPGNTRPSIVFANVIDQNRFRYDLTRENIAGVLGTYIWLGKKMYAKLDAAYGNVRQKAQVLFFLALNLMICYFLLGTIIMLASVLE